MKLTHRIRKTWHDWFFKNASKERFEFALRCQDVTAEIDLHQKPHTISNHFRFWLHMSLCQACKNYYDFSKTLSRALNQNGTVRTANLPTLNKALLEKYAKKVEPEQKR